MNDLLFVAAIFVALFGLIFLISRSIDKGEYGIAALQGFGVIACLLVAAREFV